MKAKVKIQRDLKKIKTKVVFNLTLRQIICFSIGALIGLPTYFYMRKAGNETVGMFAMIIVMLPAFLFAMYEKDGLPLEQILINYWRWNHERPKKRVKKQVKTQEKVDQSRLRQDINRSTKSSGQKLLKEKPQIVITNRKGGNTAGEARQHETTRVRAGYPEQREPGIQLQGQIQKSEGQSGRKRISRFRSDHEEQRTEEKIRRFSKDERVRKEKNEQVRTGRQKESERRRVAAL